MHIICAPDSFKESISATDAAEAMAAGIRRIDASLEIVCLPIADGGEGTLDALVNAMEGAFHRRAVLDARGEPIEARFGTSSDRAHGVVELAEASGLARLEPSKRDPTLTTTFGTGQLIAAAMEAGCETIIVGIGGSATCDGAAGLAQALGAKFIDSAGHLITEPLTGGSLPRIARFEPPPRLPRIRVACDVRNPLVGPEGAAAVYGPQKGATPEQVELLDRALAHLAMIVGGDSEQPGAGAAGGAGYGLAQMCGATLEPGVELVLNAVHFEERCRGASLVLTGEGRLDEQTLHGKAIIGVAGAAKRCGVETIAIVGSASPGMDRVVSLPEKGLLLRWVSLEERYGMERALSEPGPLIEAATTEVVQHWMRGQPRRSGLQA